MAISEMAGLSDHSDGSIMCHKKSGIVSPGLALPDVPAGTCPVRRKLFRPRQARRFDRLPSSGYASIDGSAAANACGWRGVA
jgi:hypothetical protein